MISYLDEEGGYGKRGTHQISVIYTQPWGKKKYRRLSELYQLRYTDVAMHWRRNPPVQRDKV